MILAIDVDYRGKEAIASAISFNHWHDQHPTAVYHSKIAEIAEYEPGAFYKRELPCILTLIQEHQLKPNIIIIDGFVSLGEECRPGLGMYLFEVLNKKIPIIGVAKKPFLGTPKESEILRGNSLTPLYISSVAITREAAQSNIISMHGKYRIPTLLKFVDSACRQADL
ncbi:endonuclease V [Microbulbifer variabilis]|uniref:endonuclease V n=1 Tax=Microbulbifer variabilis TaxID=266805 RepID=UPI001CFE375C|nr:endonuclease V [Microbulbifer variabilis]